MLKQKEITIPNHENVTQVTLRSVSEFFLIFDHNMIELYSSEISFMENYLKELFYCPESMEKEILEIGSRKIFDGSNIINVSELLYEKEKPYGLLNKLNGETPQILIVHSDKLLEKNNLELLSDIACSADKLRVILFLTVGEKAKVLPFVNFAQVNSLPLTDVIHYRNYFEKEVTLIEQFVDRLNYNYMI